MKPALYMLNHGIEVIGEYAPTIKNPYWRVRIRPHAFFPNVLIRHGGIYVRRSRVILASKLGRALTPQEHAHHDDENRINDNPANVKMISPSEHNKHHKTGFHHRADSKAKTSATLRRLYASGIMKPKPITKRDSLGRISK